MHLFMVRTSSLGYVFCLVVLILCLFEVSLPGKWLSLASAVCSHELILKEPGSIGRLMRPAALPLLSLLLIVELQAGASVTMVMVAVC